MEFQEQLINTYPGKGLESSRLVRVSNLGLVAGLLALLLVTTAACSGEEPEATVRIQQAFPSLTQCLCIRPADDTGRRHMGARFTGRTLTGKRICGHVDD